MGGQMQRASDDQSIVNAITGTSTSTDIEGLGKVADGTTAVEIAFSGTTEAITLTADNDNTGVLYIGKSDVLSDGSNAFELLQAGESVSIDYDDSVNGVYVVASVVSQNVWAGALK